MKEIFLLDSAGFTLVLLNQCVAIYIWE